MKERTDTDPMVDQCEYCDRTELGGACLHENPCPAWEAFKEEEEKASARKRRTDTDRLEWLATQFKTTTVYMSGDALYAPSRLLYGLKGRGFREAIDAAMDAEERG